MDDRDAEQPDGGNPYAPPVPMYGGPPSPAPAVEQKAGGAVKVYGVLSIVFGAIVALMSLATSCGAGLMSKALAPLATLNKTNPGAVTEAYQRYVDTTYALTLGTSLAFSLMSIALLAIGIGQVRFRRWARSATLWWAGIALALLVVQVLLSFLVAGPAAAQLNQALQSNLAPDSVAAQMQQLTSSMTGGPMMAVISVVFYAPYPILLLLYFSRASTASAMDR